MDTISRENNTSYLPIFGVAVGVIALILAGVALKKISTVGESIATQETKLTEISSSVESVRGEISNASREASAARAASTKLAGEVNSAFSEVANQLGAVRGDVLKIQEAQKAPVKAPAGAAKGPVVAGPNEYIVKSGDGGSKIAKANGVSIADLTAVNPGIDWTKLKPGQKIKLPVKK
ncbi:MAG: LysM peptidoglycan-binding domain-containing protein [Opitutaceae bacterium]|nr:LysM peptidoglycan-binding domain-containing protein [Opitutaceae bacterium]